MIPNKKDCEYYPDDDREVFIFTDEYGTSTYKGLDKDNNDIFCLSNIVIKKEDCLNLCSAFQKFKNKFFPGNTPLHFQSISKKKIKRNNGNNPYNFLNNQILEEEFHTFLNNTIKNLSFISIPIIIDKRYVKDSNYKNLINPYLASIQLLLEKLSMMSVVKIAWYVEKRGSKEDRIVRHKINGLKDTGVVSDYLPCHNEEKLKSMDVKTKFLSKSDLCSGIEIADLCGYSIGRTVRDYLNKNKDNTWKYSFRIFKTLYYERRIRLFEDKLVGIFGKELIPDEIIKKFEKKRALRPATGNPQSKIKH